MLPCLNARLVSVTVIASISTLCPFSRSLYKFSQRRVLVPKLYVLFALGIISLLTSARNSTLSVASLPKVKFPPNVISPVACKLPVMFVLAYTSTVPESTGLISKFEFGCVVEITLSLIKIIQYLRI